MVQSEFAWDAFAVAVYTWAEQAMMEHTSVWEWIGMPAEVESEVGVSVAQLNTAVDFAAGWV